MYFCAAVTSKPAYTTSAYSKPSEWQNVGGPGSQPSHVFPVLDGLATTSQMSTEAGETCSLLVSEISTHGFLIQIVIVYDDRSMH